MEKAAVGRGLQKPRDAALMTAAIVLLFLAFRLPEVICGGFVRIGVNKQPHATGLCGFRAGVTTESGTNTGEAWSFARSPGLAFPEAVVRTDQRNRKAGKRQQVDQP